MTKDDPAQTGSVDSQRQRARTLGITPGKHDPGAVNSITDVDGVRVGQVTVIAGDSIQTGVTVIVPDAAVVPRSEAIG